MGWMLGLAATVAVFVAGNGRDKRALSTIDKGVCPCW